MHTTKKNVLVYTPFVLLYTSTKVTYIILLHKMHQCTGSPFRYFTAAEGTIQASFRWGPIAEFACYKLDTREPRQLHILGLDASHSAY